MVAVLNWRDVRVQIFVAAIVSSRFLSELLNNIMMTLERSQLGSMYPLIFLAVLLHDHKPDTSDSKNSPCLSALKN